MILNQARWQQAWAGVGSEEWLCARRILEADPHHTLAQDLLRFADRDTHGLDPFAWIEDVDAMGRGWSSTEGRSYQLIAALFDPDRTIKIRGVLDYMGSWETEVWAALVEWGTGGRHRLL